VKHFASPKFWTAYEALPSAVRRLADANFELLKRDPRHQAMDDVGKVSFRWYRERKSAAVSVATAGSKSGDRWTEASDGHNIACKIDGIGAMNLKSEFVKKA
jgi:hypothetical protein